MKAILIGAIYTLFLCSPLMALQKIQEGIYSGEGKTTDGEAIYFGLERVTKENIDKWKLYKYRARMVSQTLENMTIRLEKPNVTDKELESISLLDENENRILVNKLKTDLQFYKGIFGQNGVQIGIGGSQLLEFEKSDVYIAYISKRPVKGPFTLNNEFKVVLPKGVKSFVDVTIEAFARSYDDIIMSVDLLDLKDTPLVINRGIFKNPLDFLKEKQAKGLAMALLGFSAVVVQKFFPGKIYTWINPTETMQNIIQKSMNKGELFIGTDKTGVMNEKFPPIMCLVEGKYIVLERIFLKEGTDILMCHDTATAKENAQFVVGKDAQIPMAIGLTPGEYDHIIKLTALEKFFYAIGK